MSSRSSSSSPPSKSMGRRSCARKCERGCCLAATYFPLPVVYSLTTWAVWTSAGIGLRNGFTRWSSETESLLIRGLVLIVLLDPIASLLIITLFCLLNWCYTTAVFTPPGSPSDQSGAAGYSSLPTHEPSFRNAPSLQAKSTGEMRFCKKCQSRKPDRTHHCSTCKQCVLKMDHHCPWLATCVGLRNYKAFLLFLIYTSIYCCLVFAVTTLWLWNEVLNDSRYAEDLSPINQILLCVVSGIIALVLTGFTIWHISLATRGMTTIECLEKTRYLSTIRKQMRNQASENGFAGQNYGQQLVEIHANAVPGATRDEEGEVLLSNSYNDPGHPSAKEALKKNYAEMERSRERDRYEDYLDEQDSEKLPRAFDLGWRQNLLHLFGEKRLFWFLPVCNTTGDGWHWDISQNWVEARDRVQKERESQRREDHAFAADQEEFANRGRWHNRVTSQRQYLSPDGSPSSRMSMQTLRRRSSFDEDAQSGDGGDDNGGPTSFQSRMNPPSIQCHGAD